MNSQLSVETITQQINHYNNLALVLLVASIAMLVSAVVLFIALNIPHSIRVLTGMGMSKEINKISKDAKNGKSRASSSHKATVSWNSEKLSSSGKLSNSGKLSISDKFDQAISSIDTEATTVLGAEDATTVLGADDATTLLGVDDATTVLGCEETTVLTDDATTLLQEEQTTLLSDFTPRPVHEAFEFEEDIKITGSNKRL